MVYLKKKKGLNYQGNQLKPDIIRQTAVNVEEMKQEVEVHLISQQTSSLCSHTILKAYSFWNTKNNLYYSIM